jgi:hypothetical protein
LSESGKSFCLVYFGQEVSIIEFADENELKLDDLFGKIYQVKAINADSVVLLKGDEIITLFINEVYYD